MAAIRTDTFGIDDLERVCCSLHDVITTKPSTMRHGSPEKPLEAKCVSAGYVHADADRVLAEVYLHHASPTDVGGVLLYPGFNTIAAYASDVEWWKAQCPTAEELEDLKVAEREYRRLLTAKINHMCGTKGQERWPVQHFERAQLAADVFGITPQSLMTGPGNTPGASRPWRAQIASFEVLGPYTRPRLAERLEREHREDLSSAFQALREQNAMLIAALTGKDPGEFLAKTKK